LSFLAYLLILRLIGVLTAEDEQAMVTRIFTAYLAVVRRLQKVYKLEPAGSKGVWGLDDHQHLVYLWGASQLRTHPTMRPSSILAPSAISPHGVSYLFLSSILHVNDLKSGPFAEHSPMLHNIASRWMRRAGASW
jgi:serine/threonine-protein phosphatase 2A activator